LAVISVSSYRFCRTDDIGLLVHALNRCWAPYFPDEPAITPETFKRSIRDLQVWCSSCMVAFAGSDPIGVLIGAKRPAGTLVHRIAVHPDHRHQGHGQHLLTSLGSKLAILGPPRIIAEIPETLAPARGLFATCGYAQEAMLTDYVLRDRPNEPAALSDGANGRFVIPVTVDDLSANGLFEAHTPTCWQRSIETLTARKHDLSGVAVASEERIDAFILYAEDGEILSLRSFVEDGAALLMPLLSRVRAVTRQPSRMLRVHPEEISKELLEALGFRAAGGHVLVAARAQAA
jgi:GNAT superfamily N-acetyltransferase